MYENRNLCEYMNIEKKDDSCIVNILILKDNKIRQETHGVLAVLYYFLLNYCILVYNTSLICNFKYHWLLIKFIKDRPMTNNSSLDTHILFILFR